VGVAVAIVVVALVAAAAGLAFALGGGGGSGGDDASAPTVPSDAPAPTTERTDPPTTELETTVPTTAAPTTTTAPPLVAIAVEESPASQAAVDTFTTYFQGLNDHDFARAHGALSAAKQQKLSVETMASGAATSHDTDIVIESVDKPDDARLVVVVSFTSTQAVGDSANGDTCTKWRMRYELVPSGAGWGIDAVSGADGGEGWSNC
jgi:hypothetical protein